jgi:two-component system response regulator YesN
LEGPRKFKAIVAEDEPMIRGNIIKKINEAGAGFLVAGEAHNGQAALELVEELCPDLLVTDIRMPLLSGLELIEHCYRFHPSLETIIISGYSDFAYARTALRFGVSDYILKPVDRADLASALSRIRLRLSKAEADFAAEGPEGEGGARGDIAAAAAEIIRERFREHPSINALSDSLRVNPAYLTRAFKESFDVTPSRYALDLRISAARKLLEEEAGLEVKEIAAALGYSDQCYFSRAFKRMTGSSPLEYRASRLGVPKPVDDACPDR